MLFRSEKIVTVRGPEALLAAMTADSVRILVDFSSAEVGTSSYKATATVVGTLADSVGTVGVYDVKATIQ